MHVYNDNIVQKRQVYNAATILQRLTKKLMNDGLTSTDSVEETIQLQWQLQDLFLKEVSYCINGTQVNQLSSNTFLSSFEKSSPFLVLMNTPKHNEWNANLDTFIRLSQSCLHLI